MDDAGGVGIGETLGELGKDGSCLRPAVGPVASEGLIERGAVYVFEGKERHLVSEAVVEDLDDMDRVDPLGKLSFALEAADVVGILGVGVTK